MTGAARTDAFFSSECHQHCASERASRGQFVSPALCTCCTIRDLCRTTSSHRPCPLLASAVTQSFRFCISNWSVSSGIPRRFFGQPLCPRSCPPPRPRQRRAHDVRGCCVPTLPVADHRLRAIARELRRARRLPNNLDHLGGCSNGGRLRSPRKPANLPLRVTARSHMPERQWPHFAEWHALFVQHALVKLRRIVVRRARVRNRVNNRHLAIVRAPGVSSVLSELACCQCRLDWGSRLAHQC